MRIVEVDDFRPRVIRQQAESRTELTPDLDLHGVVAAGSVAAEKADRRSPRVERRAKGLRRLAVYGLEIHNDFRGLAVTGRRQADEALQCRLIQIVVRQLTSAVIENMRAFVGDIRNLEVRAPV